MKINTGREKVISLDSYRRKSRKTGGGGGGNNVDSETKNYVDAKTEATRAENDKRFSQILDKLDGLPSKNSQTVTILGAAGALFLGLLAVLAFAGDRFDGGMSASTDAAVSQAVISELDEKIDKMIDKQAAENQKMINALADHHKNQSGFKAP